MTDVKMKDVPRRTFASEEEWQEYEESRGALAGTPEYLVCYKCTRDAGGDPFDEPNAIARKVVRLGGVAEAHRDPTQTYVLECGHTVI